MRLSAIMGAIALAPALATPVCALQLKSDQKAAICETLGDDASAGVSTINSLEKAISQNRAKARSGDAAAVSAGSNLARTSRELRKELLMDLSLMEKLHCE